MKYTNEQIEAVASVLSFSSGLDAERMADKAAKMLRSLLAERQAARSVVVSDEEGKVHAVSAEPDSAEMLLDALDPKRLCHASGQPEWPHNCNCPKHREPLTCSAVVGDEDVQSAVVAAEQYSTATRIGWEAMRSALSTFAQSHGVAGAVKVPDVLTYANQPGNVCAYRLGGAARNAKPGGDSIDHGLSLLQQLQLRGFGVVPLDASQPEGKHYDAATQEKAS